MAKELAFSLLNPYSLEKSRTGGIIARYLSRTGLSLVAARMYGPSQELAERYAERLRSDNSKEKEINEMLADYVMRCYAPTPDGRPARVLLLLFEGEDAIEKVCQVTGNLKHNTTSGETIRDTYGDFIVDESRNLFYLEPAVMRGCDRENVIKTLSIWSEFAERDGGIIDSACDLADEPIEKTLVLIKPDNFRFPNVRPGNIIDIFSRSGLRIIGAKVHKMSCAEAEAFYGPVRDILREKLKGKVAAKSAEAIHNALGMEIPDEVRAQLADLLGPLYGDYSFNQIVQFMTGIWPDHCPAEEKKQPGKEQCLALVYAGTDAVNKIRGILGSTDPSKADAGTVRRELGQNVMVNAAHASDSPENSARELGIVHVEGNDITLLFRKYYA